MDEKLRELLDFIVDLLVENDASSPAIEEDDEENASHSIVESDGRRVRITVMEEEV